jgi:hypothetical protein
MWATFLPENSSCVMHRLLALSAGAILALGDKKTAVDIVESKALLNRIVM